VLHCEGEEIDVGEVIGRGKFWKNSRRSEGDVILPELVSGKSEKSGKDRAGSLRRFRPAGIFASAKNAEKTTFDKRTCGPSIAGEACAEEMACCLCVRMGGIA